MPLGTSLPAPLPESTGTNYFTSWDNGNDTTGDGSILNPWKTITKILTAKGQETGAILNCRGGNYLENVKVASRHGTSGNPVTLQPYQNETVTVVKQAAAGSNFPFTLDGWQYVRIRGLHVDGAQIDNSGVEDADVYLTGSSSNVTIEQCEVTQSFEQGILADDGCNDNQFMRNNLHGGGRTPSGNRDHAMYIQGDRNLICNNVIGDWTNGHCVQIFPRAADQIICNNTIHHTDFVSGGYHSSAILVGSGPGDPGDSSDHVIVNNLIYSAANGIQGYNQRASTPRLVGGITLPTTPITLNSVTSMDTTNGQLSIGDVNTETVSTAIVAYTGISGNQITGCTTLQGSGTSWANNKLCQSSPTDYVAGTGTVAHHNAMWAIIYMPYRNDPQSGSVAIIDVQGNDVTSDPLVVSDSGRDYHLQSGSPLYSAGVDAYTPAVDYDGNTRIVATIGAYAAPEEANATYEKTGVSIS